MNKNTHRTDPARRTSSPDGVEDATNDPSRVDQSTLDALLRAEHGDPFGTLGMHRAGTTLVLRALLPGALAVDVIDSRERRVACLAAQDGTALFTTVLPRRRNPFAYRLRVQWRGEDGEPLSPVTIDDPYRFGALIEDLDVWLLAEGSHHRPYEWLGAHPGVVDGVAGTRFAVWAPNARRVSVVGGFNQWDGRRLPMRLRRECGFW